MKHIIIIGDGMADRPMAQLGGKTLLQYARIPYMDLLARNGRCGLLKTVPDDMQPGSEVANSSILGYDQHKVYEGRGPLEAASIGIPLEPGDFAIRCNLICLENGCIKNHSAGHLTTEEGDVLIRFLQEKLGSERVHFHTGIQYRHLLIIKGGDKHIECAPPHDHPLEPWKPLLVKATAPEGKATADLLNDLILRSQELLATHPLNLQRVAEGKDPANSIWPWSGGYHPAMAPLSATWPQIHSGAVITAVDLIRGIGRYAGLHVIDVEGATGLYNTNYEGKAQAAIEALRQDDFVFVHVEASDEAGHDGNLELKLKTIENLDSRLIGPIYEAVKNWGVPGTEDASREPVAIAVLPDHPTPVALRTHSREAVPFLINAPGITPDSVQAFDEDSCASGSYGRLEGDGFMKALMAL
ncbi:MAG: cofactor-independent phosphoglycerate mutase [Bacteroidales bacterium]|nr:cofactor-independent phosphoglycerate mutase [Bacteroidales bacterium]